MAPWRVLDITSAPLRGASSTRHEIKQPNEKVKNETPSGKGVRR